MNCSTEGASAMPTATKERWGCSMTQNGFMHLECSVSFRIFVTGGIECQFFFEGVGAV